MLMDIFLIPKQTASALYSLPYFISAGIAPFLGIAIDKIGKRSTLVTVSSVLVVIACITTQFLVRIHYTDANYLCLIPLILLGFAYSIYASSLWTSIPYVVLKSTLGTAFGLCTSV